jgi:hypothetical protein
VIEHLDDDRNAVARLASLARPGGALIISVPALPQIFSSFDSIQGHRRRYTPETLSMAFHGTDLTITEVLWWGRWLLPVLRRQRMKTRTRPGDSPTDSYRRYLALPPLPFVWLARLAFALEQELTIRGKLRTGTSLLVVARRDNSPGLYASRELDRGKALACNPPKDRTAFDTIP